MPLFRDPVARPQINGSGILTGYALNTPTLYHQLYTPTNAVTGAIDYHTLVLNDKTLRFHFDGSWSDGVYTSTGDVSTGTKDSSGNTIYLPQLKTQAGAIFNARLGLSDIRLSDTGARLTLSLWARNIFNVTLMNARSGSYIQPSSSVTGGFNDPRTFGGTVSAKF
jgi:iron complex outermembrane receptor protein